MALSDSKIIKHLNKNIVIHPFLRENLNTSSYDVTLGEFYYTENSIDSCSIYNPYSEEMVRKVWGGENDYKTARPLSSFNRLQYQPSYMFNGLDNDSKIIWLAPGETILAHTNEFIGGRNHITTMMKARSSLGRNFIEVCKCAGWGDIGYINRWTMEITNNSQHYTIPLVVGRRIAQIVFFDAGPVISNSYENTGKYQTESDIEALINSWHPSMMLPKLYKDRDIGK